MTALSIGFLADPDRDVVDARDRRDLPLVRRRGVRLMELSLVGDGAYPAAKIFTTDLDRYEHERSETIMRPFREQKAREADQAARAAAQRREADAALLASITAPAPWTDTPGPPHNRGYHPRMPP